MQDRSTIVPQSSHRAWPDPSNGATVAAWTLATACGAGRGPMHAALEAGQSGLVPNDYPDSALDTWIGRVREVDEHSLPDDFASLDSRNNRLADLALGLDGFDRTVLKLREHVGAHRIGVILGTSTASIGRTESAYAALVDGRVAPPFRQPEVHNPHSVSHYVATRLGLGGPTMSISTACSSSGKVFAAAARWLAVDLVDAVVVGGVDSLCLSILHGFASLELVSRQHCRPFDIARDGINIGEAAGFALLLAPETPGYDYRLVGSGETSDAWHMAQPHPEGRGARDAMQQALAKAGLAASDIGYVNLHGTATPANDSTEALALAGVFREPVPASSTKAWTGHTLGAAGIVGALTALDVLESGHVPYTLNLDTPEPGLAYPVLRESTTTDSSHVMCNSLGFGGNNCSLIFGRTG